jgi:hypothetical protein
MLNARSAWRSSLSGFPWRDLSVFAVSTGRALRLGLSTTRADALFTSTTALVSEPLSQARWPAQQHPFIRTFLFSRSLAHTLCLGGRNITAKCFSYAFMELAKEDNCGSSRLGDELWRQHCSFDVLEIIFLLCGLCLVFSDARRWGASFSISGFARRAYCVTSHHYESYTVFFFLEIWVCNLIGGQHER